MEFDMGPELNLPSLQTVNQDRPVTQYFEGEVRPLRLSLGYKVGLGAILAAMIALPLIYLGLIACMAWGVYLYAVYGLKLLGVIRYTYGFLLIYAAPLAAGVILICFMIKPIF